MARTIGGVPAIKSQNGLILLADWSVTSATLDQTLTVNGGVDKFLTVLAHYSNSGAAAANLSYQFNGDTGTNYIDRNIQVVTTTVSGSSNTSSTAAYIGVIPTATEGHGCFSKTEFAIGPGTNRGSAAQINVGLSAYIMLRHGIWKNVADNITSIRFFTNNNITGHIQIWKRV